ncbi:MAG TPA: ATP-binding SpoIIE family protein phosphatase [Vicinamibacterales bacterium]
MEVTRAHRRIAVVESSQPSAGRFAARDAAESAGLNEEDSYRAGLIATELATNLVKHATGGELLVREIAGSPQGEVEILAIDRGPGMSDLSRSMTDGHSTAGSAGTGLGAVRRLADEFDIYSEQTRGTVVLVRVRAARHHQPPSRRLSVGAVSVAMKGEPVCGDGWQVLQRRESVLVIVADGLGHGIQASEASTAAIGTFNPAQAGDLTEGLRAMHDALRHTRGAAAAVAEIFLHPRLVKFAGIGNISGTIHRPGLTRHTVSLNGTLGHEARTFREYSYPWESDAMFVMHSDGLATHWSLDDYRGLQQRHPAIVAAVLYRDFSRQRDDVTVVVGREAA